MKKFLGKVRRRALRLLGRAAAPASSLPVPEYLPQWGAILENRKQQWAEAQQAARKGAPILIATAVGGFTPGTILDSALAVALTLRGANVYILLCDETLPACVQAMSHQFEDREEFADFGPLRRLCATCYAPANAMYQALGLPILRLSEFLAANEKEVVKTIAANTPLEKIGEYCWQDFKVGEHALAGAFRFFARGDFEGEPYSEAIIKRYFEASLLTAYAMQRMMQKYHFARVSVTHGIYVPYGLIVEVARKAQARLVTWNVAYRKQCFIFSHDETYHHAYLTEPTALWENMEWRPDMEAEILAYLKSRWYGTGDWISFQHNPTEEVSQIEKTLGLSFSKPTIGLLSNVIWDAQLFYLGNAFPNMLTWVFETIRYFERHPDIQLIIRIHPAEVKGTMPSRQKLLPEIEREFPTLPANVFIIPPESAISTYAVLEQCNAALIYGSKTGVELTSLGIPVITAGEAWIRNKGITHDASSPEDYFNFLGQLPFLGRMSDAATERARKYAYHFFFRRMIPLEFLEMGTGWPPYNIHISSLDDLKPGHSTGLDLICDGILKGTEFIYPAETLSAS